MNLKHQLFLFISLGISVVSAQGNFFNEGQVVIDPNTVLKIAGNLHLDNNIQGDGEVQLIEAQTQKIIGGNIAFKFLGMQKSGSFVSVDKTVRIDSLLNFQGGVWKQISDTLIVATGAKLVGGNSNSYLYTNINACLSHFIDANDVHLPLGSETYHPLQIKENGTPDTFYVTSTSYLPDNGRLNTGVPLNQHVAKLSWCIADKNAGNNQLDVLFSWEDLQNAVPFNQKYATVLYYDTITANKYESLEACGVDVSTVNPNEISINNITSLGLFGIGDSLYLLDHDEVIVQPNGVHLLCEGDSVLATLNLSPLGAVWNNGAVAYQQWLKQPGVYFASYVNQLGCTIYSTDSLQLTVIALPVPVITRNGAVLSTGSYDTYQWFFNGAEILGANSSQIEVSLNGIYTVKVSNASDNCYGQSAGLNVNNIGINEAAFADILLGPNPAINQSSWIKLNLNEEFFGNIQLDITDVLGRVISTNSHELNQTPQLFTFSLPHTGVYFLTIRTLNGTVKTFKWVSL